MTKQEAEALFKNQMRDWGLLDKGWKFQWGRAMNSIGCVIVRRRYGITISKKLTMSYRFFEINLFDPIYANFLHELAHALVYEMYGDVPPHGVEFKQIAHEIGVPEEAHGCIYRGDIKIPTKKERLLG